jgi:hypothetical protein
VGDTWEWDGAAWHDVTPAVSPPARASSAMAYDVARQRTVLFGGSGGSGLLHDTWEWDGTSWTEASPQATPEPREGHAMVYDRARGHVMMLAGKPLFSLSLWEWDGRDWSARSPGSGPAPRANPLAAYDDARRELILFGGARNSTFLFGDQWELTYLGPDDEVCLSGIDADRDGKIGCADEDCRTRCQPGCLDTCDPAAPSCGDGVCSALENDRLCPADCVASSPLCGDEYCTPGEVCAADCP